MLFWFVIVAPVIVAEVFRSPMVDYRMVALGAAIPMLDLLIARASFLHTMVFAVGSLAFVMLITIGRRLLRRRLLGIPIGLMLHLVLDFVWLNDTLLLWPAFGWSLSDVMVPLTERSQSLNIGLELIAVGIGVWARRRYELDDPDNLETFRKTGRLPRSATMSSGLGGTS